MTGPDVDRLGNIERHTDIYLFGQAILAACPKLHPAQARIAALNVQKVVEAKSEPPANRGAVEALRRYARHTNDCAMPRQRGRGECDCGLSASLARIGGR